ncbi:MAG: response regulator transcription factor [Chloroflexi bacterium]|nr:response regulator transcription factor [Chloroflexota bacterium]
MRILVVDDDERLVRVLRRALMLEGYDVDVAADGRQALLAVRDTAPDLVVLDVGLPQVDGLEVCRRIRKTGNLPVLMLTARETVPDRVKGLDSGADDYMVKPFDLDELLARVRALLRYGGVALNPATREASRNERRLDLTPKEFELLELFLRNPRQALSRELISDRVWGYAYEGESNVIDVCVKHLREKLEEGQAPRLVQTIRGVGYALREE